MNRQPNRAASGAKDSKVQVGRELREMLPRKHLPACTKRPANSNLALPPHPPTLCESVVHNASQQQDRFNYHNQSRGASISGEPRGVNEAEMGGGGAEKDESLHEEERQEEVEGEKNELHFVGSPKTPRFPVRKLPPA